MGTGKKAAGGELISYSDHKDLAELRGELVSSSDGMKSLSEFVWSSELGKEVIIDIIHLRMLLISAVMSLVGMSNATKPHS